jgi:hypothetical protein
MLPPRHWLDVRAMRRLQCFSFDEDSLDHDDVGFCPTGNVHDFANPPATVDVNPEVDDQVDSDGDR